MRIKKKLAASLKHASERESYFKNVKYNFDAHNKHVAGHNDYKEFRSIWEHPDPEGLLKKFAGIGFFKHFSGNLKHVMLNYIETNRMKEFFLQVVGFFV